MNRGFSLIESIVYIALFSLLVVELVFSAVYCRTFGDANTDALIKNEQASFLFKKVGLLIDESKNFSLTHEISGNSELVVNDGEQSVMIALNGNMVVENRGGTITQINDANFSIDSLEFQILTTDDVYEITMNITSGGKMYKKIFIHEL